MSRVWPISAAIQSPYFYAYFNYFTVTQTTYGVEIEWESSDEDDMTSFEVIAIRGNGKKDVVSRIPANGPGVYRLTDDSKLALEEDYPEYMIVAYDKDVVTEWKRVFVSGRDDEGKPTTRALDLSALLKSTEDSLREQILRSYNEANPDRPVAFVCEEDGDYKVCDDNSILPNSCSYPSLPLVFK